MKKRSWSYSSLSLYKQCPLKYKFVKIDKLPEKPSYHLQKGIAAHTALEKFLLDETKHVPPVGVHFYHELKQLKSEGALAEESVVFNSNWECIEGDSWMHDDAWLRMKLDATLSDLVVDFKTGKHYESHKEQAHLYAISHMKRHKLDEVIVEFWYLNNGEVKTYSFTKDDVEPGIDKWNSEVEEMMNDEEFLPKENQWCKYCDFKKLCPL